MVMLGTKWPSMTSTWIQSQPACVDGAHLLAELGEVGGEDGRGDDDVARQASPLLTCSFMTRQKLLAWIGGDGGSLQGAEAMAFTAPL